MLIIVILIIASLACSLPPGDPEPGTLAEEVGKGNVRFDGAGNLLRGECQDPSVVVQVGIGGETKELDGVEFYDEINPVAVHATTDGAIPLSGTCEKYSADDKHDWPGKGIYYPKEAKIVFSSCSLADGRAEGEAFLVGEGFEGEYSCYSAEGSLIYRVAFSAYTRIR
jgi:hypothetical protein